MFLDIKQQAKSQLYIFYYLRIFGKSYPFEFLDHHV